MTGSSTNGGEDAGLNWKRLYAVLRLPLFLAAVNFFLLSTIFAFLPYGLGDVLNLTARVFVIGYGGWIICRRGIGGIRQAALTGVGIYFFDHVVLKGGVFLMNYFLMPEGMGLAAFSSVVISFLLLSPLAMVLGAGGAHLSRMRQARRISDGERS